MPQPRMVTIHVGNLDPTLTSSWCYLPLATPFKRTDVHVYLVTLVYLQPFKEARASLESQLKRKEEELRKANDSRDNIMKTMREALEVAKANKAEYDVKLATVRQQCREEMRREMDEEMRRTKRDFQKQLDDKDRSLEEAKCVEKTKTVSKTSESSKSSSSSSVSKPNVEMRPVSKNTLLLIFTGDPSVSGDIREFKIYDATPATTPQVLHI